MHSNDIALSKYLKLTCITFIILSFDFNLAVYNEEDFITFLMNANKLSFFFNYNLSHLILDLVKEHSVVVQVKGFKIFYLFQEFNFKFLDAVSVVVRVVSKTLSEHVACVEEHGFLNSSKGAIVGAFNRCGSFTVEN
jgi:hypothetical protein